jgi:cold shock CspA family protein
MVLGWSFAYTNDKGEDQVTETSQHLLAAATYPVLMSDEIDRRRLQTDPLIDNLFVPPRPMPVPGPQLVLPLPEVAPVTAVVSPGEIVGGSVLSTNKDGYGFIKSQAFPGDVFFHHRDVMNRDFDDLTAGDMVRFTVEHADRGVVAKQIVVQSPDDPLSQLLDMKGQSR